MPENIQEASWPLGWIPSNDSHWSPETLRGLLRMDNLTLDERGNVSIARGPSTESTPTVGIINSIGGMYYASKKLRYLYDSTGLMQRNYGAAALQNTYDQLVFSEGTTTKAAFLNALGHQLCIAGTKKFKDRGDVISTLGIAASINPTLTNLASTAVDLRNLNAGTYTNWNNVETSAYNDAGASVSFTPNLTTLRGAIDTVYGSVIDTTNFGSGTGFDLPTDLINFYFGVTDPNQLNYIKLELFCTDPNVAAVTDVFWAEWDYANFLTNTSPNNPYVPKNPFTLQPGINTKITIERQNFQRLGISASLGWNTIKCARVTVGTFATANFYFSDLQLNHGAAQGLFSYKVVELRDTGQYIETGIASTGVTIGASLNNITVNRSGTAVNSQATQIRTYRYSEATGRYLEVNRQTGAAGFTPASFTDSTTDEALLESWAIDPTLEMNAYRTALPDDIIGMIWFRDRVIYLNTDGFIPSFKLDMGSYDSRYLYELAGSNTEKCLFITKLDVGTFLIATTQDFYRVTGTFAEVDTGLAIIQDVNIQPLHTEEPAISRSFVELNGSILYASATGLRALTNSSTELINGNLNLLFRGATRYTIPPFTFLPEDQSLITVAAVGDRVYWGLPGSDGTIRTFVNTLNSGYPYWRLNTEAPRAMFREDDGTLLYSSQATGGYIRGMENSTSARAINLRTQFNFGRSPELVKDATSLQISIDTGGTSITATLYGMSEAGALISQSFTISSNGETILNLNATGFTKCVAFYLELSGTVSTFTFNSYLIVIIQDYPPITFSATLPYTNLGSPRRKRLSVLPFVADAIAGTISATVAVDGTSLDVQTFTGNRIKTHFWKTTGTDFGPETQAGVDWQMLITAASGMRFYKFLPPEVAQVWPMAKLWDQIGPMDLDQQGIVFGFRIRFESSTLVNYRVYDSDTMIHSGSLASTNNLDTVHVESFPKGVNSSVLKIVLRSAEVFYRHAIELKVRTTGKETEEKYILVKSN